MKKILFGIAALSLLAGCAGKNNSEKENEKSFSTYDSVSSVRDTLVNGPELKTNMDQGEVEKETPTSEDKAFEAAIPNPKKLYAGEKLINVGKYLKSLGYKGKSRTIKTMDGDKFVDEYSFTSGNKSISVYYMKLMGTEAFDVTINGDEKALEDFYKKAKKLQSRGDYWYVNIKKKGNTVSMDAGMD